jgi:hypothetical protein
MPCGFATLLKLTIVIYHADAVAPPELLRAEAVASAILRQAGIVTAWRPAVAGDLVPAPDEIAVHLLTAHPTTLSGKTNGYAVLAGDHSYAGISCPAVRESAKSLESDQSTVLGAVIAHELGHILLGTRDHATSGVMVTRLGAREIQAAAHGELQFLRTQARRMQMEAARRSAAARNVIESLHDAQVRTFRPFGCRYTFGAE